MTSSWIFIAFGFLAGAALFLTAAWQQMPPTEQVAVKLEKTDRLQGPAIHASFLTERFGPDRSVE
ncbi:hypothetical protein [Sinorhizobium alkalisoli]|uniref:Uncharacterized protein n=1 Tax=Sinorhizobium alkalisoli TaxID=1752398 RepID=A0A1E3VG60_9HYPH|nr:hypothetical protein [Sinorhizobium alkalisoli]MCG5480295.1 hypothetical protein [Sinorhizobium alkalisoli]ODR92437.1 hypothetical protein A8M32_05240 [Sinorhizobium alkalisoli]QFI66863.1 hypothetical protein EKH55_1989 [Sinorhizobium alkalisoli]